MRNPFYLKRLLAALLALSLAPAVPGRTRKGDKYLKDGRLAEDGEEYEKALDLFEKAVLEDPTEAAYQLAMRRVRFQAGQSLVDRGRKLREEGKLEEALREFQKAFAIDPASSIAEQELRRTMQMIEREKKKPSAEAERGLTPLQQARKEIDERIASAMPVPQLKPISGQINTLRMTNQPVKVLYETVGKLAGINVVFDPEYQEPPGKRFSVDLANSTLEQALNYLGVITKCFWKPLSENTVFVTNDNVTKRRDYEDHVVKVFYLQNVTTVQELQEIATTIRSVTDIRRLFTYNAQSAIVVRASADQVALAEKLISDLDKPKAEVVVDVMVIEANKTRTRDLAATLTSGGKNGISIPIGFTPRNPVLADPGSSADGATGTIGTAGTTTGSNLIALGQIGKITENDFSLTLPGYFVQLLMSDRSTRVLQQPQLRAADGTKATLHIGDKYPYATGSFQPGIGTVGVSPLVSTQFQFAEVGVKVDMTPRIHGDKEVSLHVEAEISSVRDNIDVGGLKQPIIGQRRVVHDLRIREGEVSVLGGLMQGQDSKVLSGLPGLAEIPILKRLFSSENVEKNNAELLFVLIPHIVRSPEITDVNLKGVAAGNDQSVKLSFAPRRGQEAPAAPPGPAPPALPAAPSPAGAPSPAAAAPQPEAQPPAPAALPVLRFNPAAINVQPGAAFTVTLEMANASNLFAAPLRVKFDPKLLRLTEVTRGNLLAQDGGEVIFTRNIQNDSGEAAVNLSRQPEAAGVSGSGALILLNFQAIGKGAARIELGEANLLHPKAQAAQAVMPQPAVVNIQ